MSWASGRFDWRIRIKIYRKKLKIWKNHAAIMRITYIHNAGVRWCKGGKCTEARELERLNSTYVHVESQADTKLHLFITRWCGWWRVHGEFHFRHKSGWTTRNYSRVDFQTIADDNQSVDPRRQTSKDDTCTSVYVCMCVCMYVGLYACMYECM